MVWFLRIKVCIILILNILSNQYANKICSSENIYNVLTLSPFSPGCPGLPSEPLSPLSPGGPG